MINAANTQCVPQPKEFPMARTLLGNISDSSNIVAETATEMESQSEAMGARVKIMMTSVELKKKAVETRSIEALR